MNLHEYQAKEFLKKYALKIPPFVVVEREKEVEKALAELKTDQVVLKAQIHAGGRGKAGGVKIAKTKDDVHTHVKNLLGMKIVNAQTGKEGVVVQKLMVTPLISFIKEYYLALTIDRERGKMVFIVSKEGGMEIEEVAKKDPHKILKVEVHEEGKLRGYQQLEILKFLGWNGKTAENGKIIFTQLLTAFKDLDAQLLEINPLVETKEGELIVLDAKVSIDDNALYRQQEAAHQFDYFQISPLEKASKEADLAYIPLDGTIGCMVNGAGLAMATMDIIEVYGGKPANFLDVGGGASEEKVKEAFRIILMDPKVKAILINIFGGIMNCETLAKGVVAAAKQQLIDVPIVVRMEGTNVEEGKKVLKDSGMAISIANSLGEAAEKVVRASCQS